MGNWTTITVAGIVAAAPNVLLSTTVTPVYSCPFNDSVFQLQVSVAIDVGNVNIARLKRIHILNSLTGIELTTLIQPAGGWTTPVTFTSDAFAQTRAIQNGTLTFYCINDNGTTSAGAVAIAFSVRASAVTGFTSAGEVGSRYIAPEDVATRLVSLGLAFIPILDGYPQNVSYLRSLDNGANYTPIGWTMMKTAGQQIVIPTLAPGVARTSRSPRSPGRCNCPPVPIPAACLPAGAVRVRQHRDCGAVRADGRLWFRL